MKIYFLTNRKKIIKSHSAVINWLESNDNEVKFEVLNKDKADAVNVDDFDAVIFEMGGNDEVVRKVVFDSLMKSKPVLLLYEYHARKPKNFDLPEEKIVLKNLTMRGYVPSNLSNVLTRFFDILEKGRLERFNFFISKDIEEYLNWIPYGTARTRSDFIRGLIKDEMSKDKKYGEYRAKSQKNKKAKNQ